MIDDYSRDLLRSGIIEAKAGNRESARRYIDRALYMSSDHDLMAEGWYWMSQLADSPAEKRQALESCLSNDLHHARARRELAILDGKLKPEDIVDPNTTAAATAANQAGAQPASEVQRFMCPKCGGRMRYGPDGASLVCEYCTRHQSLQTSGRASEKDFLLAMATARGHGKPLAEQVFHCQGCSAQFILPARELSIICPYCGSPHVVNVEKSPDLLAPDGIIPQAFDRTHASELLAAWVQRRRDEALRHRNEAVPGDPNEARPLYLPLWTFDLGGVVDYTGEVVEEQQIAFDRRTPQIVPVSDAYPVMLSSLPIPASRKLSAPFIRLLPTFDLTAVQPYDPRYLAGWPAELYDIPMDEASLDARSQGFAIAKRDMLVRLAPLRLTSASSANLSIESFRLSLLPIWITEVEVGSASHLVLVNGQTGDIYGNVGLQPSHGGGVLGWLSDLMDDV